MKFNRTLVVLGMVAGLAEALPAAEIDGILMDKMCSMKVAKDGQKAAVTHIRECAVMVACEKSGYGVVTSDNKFIALDGVGNTLATEALTGSAKKDNLKVKVTGDMSGDRIAVTSLKLE
jgi:hypothetical protein